MIGFRIGRHIGISDGVLRTVANAKAMGCDIFQIFLSTPRKLLSKEREKELLLMLGEELRRKKMMMVVHGSYTINLCHPEDNSKFRTSIRTLVQDLVASSYIGSSCLGVIIHMGKNIKENGLSTEQAIENYAFGLRKALKMTPNNCNIILETGASQGSEVGSKIEGLTDIYGRLSANEQKRIFFCIDTCHIWATGYDISSGIGVQRFFKEFNDKIGVNKISCIHFNDSKTPLNSHVDRHADIGYGFINESGLKAVAIFAKKNNIPIITETPLSAIDSKNKEVTVKSELDKIKNWVS